MASSDRKLDLTQVLPDFVLQQIINNINYRHGIELPLSNSILQFLYLNKLTLDKNFYEVLFEDEFEDTLVSISNTNPISNIVWELNADLNDAFYNPPGDADRPVDLDERIKIGAGNIKLLIPYHLFNEKELGDFDIGDLHTIKPDDNTIIVVPHKPNHYNTADIEIFSKSLIGKDIYMKTLSKYFKDTHLIHILDFGKYTAIEFGSRKDTNKALKYLAKETIDGHPVAINKGDAVLALITSNDKNNGYITPRTVLEAINKYYSKKLAEEHTYFTEININRTRKGDDIIIKPTSWETPEDIQHQYISSSDSSYSISSDS